MSDQEEMIKTAPRDLEKNKMLGIKNIIVGAKNKHIAIGSNKQTLNVSMFSLIEFPLKKKKTTTNKVPHQSKAIFEICLILSFITTKPKKRDI